MMTHYIQPSDAMLTFFNHALHKKKVVKTVHHDKLTSKKLNSLVKGTLPNKLKLSLSEIVCHFAQTLLNFKASTQMS